MAVDDSAKAPGDDGVPGPPAAPPPAGPPGPQLAGPVTLAGVGATLADGIVAALPGWVERSVGRLVTAWSGSVPPEVAAAAARAGRDAAGEVGVAVRALLSSDVDDQRSTPLTLVRRAVRYPTEVLRAAGVPPVVRDAFDESRFADDIYGLTPATLTDVDPALAGPALTWGAAKAWEHRRRHLR